MLHSFVLYKNSGARLVPSIMDRGEVELTCTNPSAYEHNRKYSPDNIFYYLQNYSDMSHLGLYLKVYPTRVPTMEGERWFLHIPVEDRRSQFSTVLKWVNKSDVMFWQSSFRTYAQITQGNCILDYTTYVSRCFGYAFLVGHVYMDEDSDETTNFVKFFPSLHHYHNYVLFNELGLWQPPSNDYDWENHHYEVSGDDEDRDSYDDLLRSVVDVSNSDFYVSQTLSNIDMEEAEQELANLLESDEMED